MNTTSLRLPDKTAKTVQLPKQCKTVQNICMVSNTVRLCHIGSILFIHVRFTGLIAGERDGNRSTWNNSKQVVFRF